MVTTAQPSRLVRPKPPMGAFRRWLLEGTIKEMEGPFERAKEHPGSWWTAWAKWLAPYGGKLVPARRKLGDAQHKSIEPAPGRFVKERAV